jgi:CBS domain-containing protein
VRQKVREVMTPGPPWLDVTATSMHAARAMALHGAGAVLVTANGDLVGIVTDRDIVVRGLATGLSPVDSTLAQVMTPYPVWIGADEEIRMALRLMNDHHVRRLPVRDRDEVVGLVTLGDIAGSADRRSLLELLGADG